MNEPRTCCSALQRFCVEFPTWSQPTANPADDVADSITAAPPLVQRLRGGIGKGKEFPRFWYWTTPTATGAPVAPWPVERVVWRPARYGRRVWSTAANGTSKACVASYLFYGVFRQSAATLQIPQRSSPKKWSHESKFQNPVSGGGFRDTRYGLQSTPNRPTCREEMQ
jgi:hypothetical protein